MAMNTKKRFLVLDCKNAAQTPKSHGMSLPDVQSDGSPSFLKKATAIAFAKALAKKCKGSRYYVSEVLGGAVAYTPLEDAAEGVDWTDATEDGAE